MIIAGAGKYWGNIVDYYWDNIDPTNDGTIWEWLEREYNCKRSRAINKTYTWDLVFDSEEYYSLFLLRWS
jgi:hypothetical protein